MKILKKSKRFYITYMCQELIMVIIVLLALYPIFLLFVNAFKGSEEYLINKFSIPFQPTLSSIREALHGGKFFRWMFNSFAITFGSVFLGTVFSVFAAYPLAKMNFKGKNLITNIVIILMVVPAVAMIVPLYNMMSKLELINIYQGIIVVYAAIILPFSVYLLISFFRTIPNEILDSARVDGCSNFRILISIIIPLSKPSILTLIIINALWVWNELIIALTFTHTDEMRTIMAGLTVFQARFNTNVTATFAGLFISTLPLLIIYIVFQRFFIRGLLAGAIKG